MTNGRPRFRDNARLILAITTIVLVLAVLVEVLLRKSRDFSPGFLASVLLAGLTVLNLVLLFVLLLLLGRNIVRVVMERRRGVLGARLRMRLLLVFLVMAIGPSALLIVVGSDVIRQTVDRWFSVDVERLLSSAQSVATALRGTVADRCRVHARSLAHQVELRGLADPLDQGPLRRLLQARAREFALDAVSVHTEAGEVLAIVDPRLGLASIPDASGEALADVALLGREAESSVPSGGGELIRVAVPVRGRGGRPAAAIVVSTLVPEAVESEIREVQDRYSKFRITQTQRGPITAFYLLLYLFPALLVLFGAVWLALYLARRITTPLRLVAEAAERIAAGERGVRVDFASGDDEFTALIASFNRMSELLARSEEEVESSRSGLQRKNRELDERRRLTETVLETVGTGLLVADHEGTTTAANAAACHLLGLATTPVGTPIERLLEGTTRSEFLEPVQRVLSGRASRETREVQWPTEGRLRHLSLTVVPLPGPPGFPPGILLVLDDLTQLVRAQRVAAWGEVARKLAHEIKNPLTPIQLSAQRIRRAYLKAVPDLERIVSEATRAIESEVEALKTLVDEFAQFARLPLARLVSASLHEVIEQTLALYDGPFPGLRIERRLALDLPALRIDVEQMKRVIVNLVDNAIEASQKKGTVVIATEFDAPSGRVRLSVSDNGPGVPAADRDRLFVPDFSTKKGGRGLGLAIVSRIVEDHHGSIALEDNVPRGARFIVELPA